MKHETKRKIIFFVRWLLKYKPTAENAGKIEVEYKKILIVQSQQSFPIKELLMLSEDQLKYHAQMNLMSELDKIGAIIYETRNDMSGGYDRRIFEARLRIIKP